MAAGCRYSQGSHQAEIFVLKTAKVVIIEGQQAVVLPEEFRFDAEQVYVRLDRATGDVILSVRPRLTWAEFMGLRAQLGPPPDDFLADRQVGTTVDDPFDDWRR